MSKSRQQKEVTKQQLVKEFQGAKSVVFADYQGLKVAQADVLRKKARASGVDYIVAKKSLLTLAAKEAGYDLNAKQFPGMLGAAFGKEDEVAPAKVLGDAAKDTSIKLVGGIFDRQIVDAAKVIMLSKLPSKQELLGQVVGTMYAPVSAFVRALNAIRESLDKGVPAAAAPVEEKPEAPVEAAPVAPAETPAAPVETPAAAPEAPVETSDVLATPDAPAAA